MPFITKKSYILYTPLVIYLFLKNKKETLFILSISIVSFLLTDWLSNELKDLFGRIRPCNELQNIRLLVGCGKSFSMPSNHASNAFAFIVPFLMLLKSEIRIFFFLIAIAVCFSRIYVGVHYPTDIIFGASFGSLIAILLVLISNKLKIQFKKKPYQTILFIFLTILSIFRIYYITNGPLDLSPDEAHYWEWSRRLDISYYSKGPMIAYLIYLSTAIFGDTVFAIRIMAVIFSSLSSIILYQLGKSLYNEKIGLYSAIILQIIPLFATFGILFTIDSPFIFFWSSSIYLFYTILNRLDTDYNSPFYLWLLLGISIGFGLLTKYTMAFFYISALFFLVLNKDYRVLLKRKEPYVSSIISLLIFSPVLIWNYQHDWVTIKHTFGQTHLSEGLKIEINNFIDFILSQAFTITPIVFILIFISLFKLKNTLNGSFLFWFTMPIFLFFTLKSIQGKVQGNWALTGYITGIISFSKYYLDNLKNHNKPEKIFISIALIIPIIITSLAHYPDFINIPAFMNPTIRLQGWKGLGEEVSKIYDEMSNKGKVFIISDRYQISSELAFYVKGHPVTYCINFGRRMNQYDLWKSFENLIDYNAILVMPGNANLHKFNKEFKDRFERVEKRVYKAYTKKNQKIKDYTIYLCYGFKGYKQQKPDSY